MQGDNGCRFHDQRHGKMRTHSQRQGEEQGEDEGKGMILEMEFHRKAAVLTALMGRCREGQAMALENGLPRIIWKVPYYVPVFPVIFL